MPRQTGPLEIQTPLPQPQDLPVGGVGFLHTAVRLGQLRPPECVSCQLCRRSHHKPGMHVFIYFEKLQDFFPSQMLNIKWQSR